MPDPIICWKCGCSIESLPMPISRSDVCTACNTDLHVCKNCVFFDATKYRSCLEPIAIEERDKEKSNFCDYFKINLNSFDPSRNRTITDARSRLESLFGSQSEDGNSGKSAEQIAKEKLDALFSGK